MSTYYAEQLAPLTRCIVVALVLAACASPQASREPTTIATLSATEAADFTADLLRTNNGCELPCWWGIVPGDTSWADAHSFLGAFASKNYLPPTGATDFTAGFAFPAPDPQPGSLPTMQISIVVNDGVVETITVGDFHSDSYKLSEFLDRLGPPSQALLYTVANLAEASAPRPFALALFFPEHSTLATFVAHGALKGSQIEGCFVGSPSLWLWPKGDHLTLGEAAALFNWDYRDYPFMPIEQAAGTSVDEFYQRFRGVDAPVCVETGVAGWP